MGLSVLGVTLCGATECLSVDKECLSVDKECLSVDKECLSVDKECRSVDSKYILSIFGCDFRK